MTTEYWNTILKYFPGYRVFSFDRDQSVVLTNDVKMLLVSKEHVDAINLALKKDK